MAMNVPKLLSSARRSRGFPKSCQLLVASRLDVHVRAQSYDVLERDVPRGTDRATPFDCTNHIGLDGLGDTHQKVMGIKCGGLVGGHSQKADSKDHEVIVGTSPRIDRNAFWCDKSFASATSCGGMAAGYVVSASRSRRHYRLTGSPTMPCASDRTIHAVQVEEPAVQGLGQKGLAAYHVESLENIDFEQPSRLERGTGSMGVGLVTELRRVLRCGIRQHLGPAQRMSRSQLHPEGIRQDRSANPPAT